MEPPPLLAHLEVKLLLQPHQLEAQDLQVNHLCPHLLQALIKKLLFQQPPLPVSRKPRPQAVLPWDLQLEFLSQAHPHLLLELPQVQSVLQPHLWANQHPIPPPLRAAPLLAAQLHQEPQRPQV